MDKVFRSSGRRVDVGFLGDKTYSDGSPVRADVPTDDVLIIMNWERILAGDQSAIIADLALRGWEEV